jgi:hypothetical protein
MLSLLKAFIDIALWRKGPQHLPASGLLFGFTIAIYLGLTLALGSASERAIAQIRGKPPAPVLGPTLLELVVGLAWLWLLLVMFKRRERFWQSATAMVGTTGIVISPIAILGQPLLVRLGESHPLASPLMLVMVGVLVWYLAVLVHIVRNAVDVTMFPAVVLTLLYGVCLLFIQVRLFGVPA